MSRLYIVIPVAIVAIIVASIVVVIRSQDQGSGMAVASLSDLEESWRSGRWTSLLSSWSLRSLEGSLG